MAQHQEEEADVLRAYIRAAGLSFSSCHAVAVKAGLRTSFTGSPRSKTALFRMTLAFDASGSLYVQPQVGGTNTWGVVFKLSPPSGGGAWTITTFYAPRLQRTFAGILLQERISTGRLTTVVRTAQAACSILCSSSQFSSPNRTASSDRGGFSKTSLPA